MGKRRGRFLKWVGPCISCSMVTAAATTFHRGRPGRPHAQMPRGLRGGEPAGKLLIFHPFTSRSAGSVSGARASWLAKTLPRRRIPLWGALGLPSSQSARFLGFWGLATSLRARRPSGQPSGQVAEKLLTKGCQCQGTTSVVPKSAFPCGSALAAEGL